MSCKGKCQVTVDGVYICNIFKQNFFLDISSEDVAYNLTFKTGDMPYAGTDANVTLQLFGDKGQTEKIMLRQESGKTLKRFDRGRTDRFTVQTMDVGKVSKICNYLVIFYQSLACRVCAAVHVWWSDVTDQVFITRILPYRLTKFHHNNNGGSLYKGFSP